MPCGNAWRLLNISDLSKGLDSKVLAEEVAERKRRRREDSALMRGREMLAGVKMPLAGFAKPIAFVRRRGRSK